MKKNAIISTLLDRQTLVIETLLKEYNFDIITPKHFNDNHKAIADKYNTNCHIIEHTLTEDDFVETIKPLIKNKNQHLQDSSLKIEELLTKNNFSKGFSKYIIELASSRTEKITTIFEGLNLLNKKLNIKALLINQEYMIHEATLVQWALANNIPIIHLCHGALMVRGVGAVRHYLSNHLTLISKHCANTLEDMNTGQGKHHFTSMVNWDIYRNLEITDIFKVRDELNIPEDALIISFYTTFSESFTSTSDQLIYENTLNAFMEAAAKITQETTKPLFFIAKDRPNGTAFSKQQAHHKAKKLGLENNFAYIFERPEKIVVLSDINISPTSSISIESMVMGKATVNLITRPAFLTGITFAANSGVVQCDINGLYASLKEIIEDEAKREELISISSENKDFVYPTVELNATQRTTATIFEIIGEPQLAKKVLTDDNFYNNLNTQGEDQRFIVNDAFQTWRSKTQPDEITGQLMGERYNTWKNKPTFHLLLVVDESLFSALAVTLDSFELQIYKHYGISILSTAPCPIENLEEQGNIQWVQTATPFEDVNQVIESVDADWLLQLWPGDELHPQALFNIADYANLNPDWLAIYGDEVLVKLTEEELDDDVSRLGTSHPEDPAFKPDFNLDLLRSTDYVNRAVAFRKDAWQALEGYLPFAYRQNEDLVFRLAERMTLPAIGHVPYILVNRSPYTNQLIESEDYEALGATIRQLHLARCGYEQAKVLPGLHSGVYNTEYNLPALAEQADLLIATPALDLNLYNCLNSYLTSDALEATQLHLAAPVTEAELNTWLAEQNLNTKFKGKLPILVSLEEWQGELAAWQKLVEASKSEAIIFAVNRLRFVQATWLNALLDQLQRPDLAMAAPRLVSSNASIISAGQILGKNGLVGDLYENFFLEQEITGLPRAWCEQNFNVLNPSCLAVKRSKLLEQKPFNSTYKSLLGMNDLQIQLCLAGNKLVWTPLSSIALVGSNAYQNFEDDNKLFKKKWFHLLTKDPAFNPNLALRGSGLDADTLLAGKWHHLLHQRPRILSIISDPTPKQTDLSKELTQIFTSKELKESVQAQSYGHLSASEASSVNAVELARLNPDVCIYTGKPNALINTIKDLASHTTIKQWVLISSQLDFDNWKLAKEHLAGYLVTDLALFSSLDTDANTLLLTEDEAGKSICKKRVTLWVEQLFN